jgi:pimeloyl-[acyl-carrier protein] methyl ester esterase
MEDKMHPLSGRRIVFLPGLDGTGISFEPFGAVLPDDVSVCVVRYPADKPLSFEETVCCARDQIPWDEDVLVLAESFSGPVALALVGSGLINPACLVLCSTFARSPRPRMLKALGLLPMERMLKLPVPRMLLRLVVAGGAESADVLLGLWRRVRVMVSPEVLVHRLEMIRRVDVREFLPGLSIPCLYLRAASDRTVPESALFDFMEVVPDLRVRRIPGPHFILQARPRESLETIQHFAGLVWRSAGLGPPGPEPGNKACQKRRTP